MWKQADKEKDELFDLIEQVQNKFQDKGGSRLSALELRRCKWDQVMVQVQETSSRWKSSPRRASRAMQYIDKLGRNSDTFKSWLELLPAGDYGARWAADRYTKVEDEILQALVEIPEILEHSRRYVQIYKDLGDNFLELRTFDLFRSILRTLSHVMRFFKDSALRKFSESILKQGSYKEELTASLAEVRKNSERIKEEAIQCQARRLQEQGGMIHQIDQKVDQEIHILQCIYQLLHNSQLLNNMTAQSVQDDVIRRILASQAVATIAGSLSGQVSEGKDRDELSRRLLFKYSMQKARKLLGLLNYSPNTASGDVDTCLRLAGGFDENKKAQSVALIQNARFRDFMTEKFASSSLLVNGRADLSSTEGLSPLSFVAAKLVRISEGLGSPLESPYVVKYFCNQHRPYFDQSAISPPVEMMASLVGQLLDRMIKQKVDMDYSMLTREAKRIKKLNLKALCDIFRKLTYQLPPRSMLLCVIDDLARYEITPFMKETDAIIRRLARLASRHESQNRIVFKLLVTCEGRALEISKHFVNQTVNLDAEVEPDESALWKISMMG
ncbi:hypothetical protein F4861DRAFT_534017 [Xylaria intraflava]|nr:hypothetical protein F4861DRAFT_534017 [Xylaria intraflava]